MFVVKNRKIFYAISVIMIGLSIVAMVMYGFRLGIDFKGGSLLEVAYTGQRPLPEDIRPQIAALDIGEFTLQPSGSDSFILRARELSVPEKDQVVNVLSQNGTLSVIEERFDSIGPALGQESKNKSIISIVLVLLAIVFFIAFAFRKVSKPVSSWIYGLVAIVALLHDIIVPAGVFALLGHFSGVEIDTLFVTALLVILGFSVHDTIVVFDRVRENLKHDEHHKKPFDQIVGESINQTFIRSINTSLTVILSLVVLYFVGSEATRNFVLALLIGIAVGTYSSIFVGSPLLVTIEKWKNRKV